jgi:hypothetical protein
MANVFKPPYIQEYTRNASPDFSPPLITRVGKLYNLSTGTTGTKLIYTKPAGVSARLIWCFLFQQQPNPIINAKIDGTDFYFKPAVAATFTGSAPIINQPYDTAIEILSNVTVVITGTGNQIEMGFIIVEDRLINN